MVFTGAFCFSSKAVMVKLAYRYGIDPVSLLNLRMIFSMPFFLIAAIYAGKNTATQKLTGRQWIYLIFLGIVGYYLASYFDFTGLKYITAALERLILFVYPTLVIVISALLFKRPIGRKEIIALLLTYSGIALAFVNDIKLYSSDVVIGGLLIFGSALTYAMYLIGSGKLIPVIGSLRFNAYCMLVSTLAVLIHFLLIDTANIFTFPQEVYALGLLMAVFATVIPSFLLAEGIRMIGAGKASIIGSIGPVSTIILAWLILDEPITLLQMAGTALVLSGVLFVSKNH